MRLCILLRRAENVDVLAIVVAELELGNVERQVLGADLVVRPDNAAFNERPDAFNRVRVDGTRDVLVTALTDDAILIVLAASLPVRAVLVRSEQ